MAPRASAGNFYMHLRPLLRIEAPLCYHSACDRQRCGDPGYGHYKVRDDLYVSRARADDMIDLLAFVPDGAADFTDGCAAARTSRSEKKPTTSIDSTNV
jgi:hypothetical protein